MKRLFALALILLLAAAGCSPAKGSLSAKLYRDDILPESLINLFAGAPMKPVRDARYDDKGFISWAWEETSGTPKLLVVEIWMKPADCDGIYQQASSGAEAVRSTEGTSACYDGRAVHIRCGAFYVRMSMLGFKEEKEAMELLTARLAGRLSSVK
jgi:hypothetical protein